MRELQRSAAVNQGRWSEGYEFAVRNGRLWKTLKACHWVWTPVLVPQDREKMHSDVRSFLYIFGGVNIDTKYRILSMFMRVIQSFEDFRV